MRFRKVLAGLPKDLNRDVLIVPPEQEAKAREMHPEAEVLVAEDMKPDDWFVASMTVDGSD